MIDKDLKIDVQFIYFIVTTGNFVKIGITRDLKRRLSELADQFPGKFMCCKFAKFTLREEAVLFEKLCHQQFSFFRIFGEWFEFPEFMKFEDMKMLLVNMGADYDKYMYKLSIQDFSEYNGEDYNGER